jgi:hypothetical protein
MDKRQLIPDGICRIENRYYKPCPKCGDVQNYLRLSYAKDSIRLGKVCRKCSNRNTDNCHRGYHYDIPKTWFNKSKTSAEIRKLEFTITINDVYSLYLKQDKKCALTDLDLYWEKVGTKHIVSIDRIDSKIGYILSNIQLIHKDLNFMKQQYSQDYFMDMCELVAIKKNKKI